jgi:cell division protein FtsZ
VLRQAVQGISDVITMPGLINLDFADIRSIIQDAGSALMGIGRASGPDRAVEAARQATESPMVGLSVAGARGILFNITGSANLSLHEMADAAEEVRLAAHPEANIIFGACVDDRMADEVQVTVIATGFDAGLAALSPARASVPAAPSWEAAAAAAAARTAVPDSQMPMDAPGPWAVEPAEADPELGAIPAEADSATIPGEADSATTEPGPAPEPPADATGPGPAPAGGESESVVIEASANEHPEGLTA